LTKREWKKRRRPCYNCGRVGWNQRRHRTYISGEWMAPEFRKNFEPFWAEYIQCARCYAVLRSLDADAAAR